jgi:hypothetical protein
MVDHQEVTWVSTRPWIRSSKGVTGARQETALRNGAGSLTFVQPVAALEQRRGPNASVQCRSPFLKDSHWCSRATKETTCSLWTILLSGRKPTPFPSKSCWQWCRGWLPACSAILEYRRSHVVTRAVWCRRFCSAWEWASHAPHIWKCNRTVWSNATSKWSSRNYRMPLPRTREIGPKYCPASSSLILHPLMTLQAGARLV